MRSRFLVSLCCVCLLVASGFGAATPPVPKIGSVHGRNVSVTVPAGYKSVTLRQRTGLKVKPWKVLGTLDADQAGGSVLFVLKKPVAPRALAVIGEFATSTTTTSSAGLRVFLADPALIGTSASGGLTLGDTNFTIAGSLSQTSVAGVASAPRSVVESDIWRVAGDRMYFFNQLRGLQVFDVSDPDDPALLGQLREPNRGEQMYLLDPDHVALLTRQSYYFSLSLRPVLLGVKDPLATDPRSGALVIADVKAGKPTEVARLTYPGELVESRLVGHILYVVSQLDSLKVTSFDLADSAHPRQVDSLDLDRWGGVVTATDRFLFVVAYSTDWRHSVINVVDISSPTGALVRGGQIETTGQVWDKFKLHLEGTTLTTVSARSREWSGDWNAPANQPYTAVETFSLAKPAAPVRLGYLQLGVGETVRAARFADGRLYVVTFFSIDPLWVVDLADASAPTVLGELKVPGFSTYIEPLGDRLVAVGIVDSKTAVSLFDVSDPAAPALLSQLPLGDGYSYSTANWDEKALTVLPDSNLILVPYSGYDASSGWASRIQLIDLFQGKLVARGVIEHGFQAQRTAVLHERILALSSTNLLTVKFADRDHPSVTSDVEIAWNVDRVLSADHYLVEIGATSNWQSPGAPTITLTDVNSPDTAVKVLALEDNLPVAGSTIRAGKLYVIQQRQGGFYPVYSLAASTQASNASPTGSVLSIFDVSQLPAIKRLGRVQSDDASVNSYSSAELTPVWPADDTLVWVRALPSYRWWGGPIYGNVQPVAVASPLLTTNAPNVPVVASKAAKVSVSTTAAVSNTVLTIIGHFEPWNYYPPYVPGREFLAYKVADPSAPVLASRTVVGAGSSGDWSAPIVAGSKVYVSSRAFDDAYVTLDVSPIVSHRNRHFLQSVDFADAAKPVVGAEVNIPGRLLNISSDATTLLTVGCGFSATGEPIGKRAFHTSKFDGSSAALVDQLETGSVFDAFAMDGDTLLVSTTAHAQAQGGLLQAWQVGPDQKLAKRSELAAPVFQNLSTLRGLLVGSVNQSLALFDVSDAAALRAIDANLRELQNADLSDSAGGAGAGIWQAQGSLGVGTVHLPR